MRAVRRRRTSSVLGALALVAACTAPREESNAAGGSSTTEVLAGADSTSAAAQASDVPATADADARTVFAGGTAPSYPAMSRRLGEEGTVEVGVDVDESGAVQRVAITRSSGLTRLDDAVLAAARTWRFGPRTGQRGVERSTYRFVFRLEGR
jgi:protein TonB